MSKAGADPSGRRDQDAPDRRGDRDREPRSFDLDWRTVATFHGLLLLARVTATGTAIEGTFIEEVRYPRRDGSKFSMPSPAITPRITPRSAP
jgi:hypothetical protein